MLDLVKNFINRLYNLFICAPQSKVSKR